MEDVLVDASSREEIERARVLAEYQQRRERRRAEGDDPTPTWRLASALGVSPLTEGTPPSPLGLGSDLGLPPLARPPIEALYPSGPLSLDQRKLIEETLTRKLAEVQRQLGGWGPAQPQPDPRQYGADWGPFDLSSLPVQVPPARALPPEGTPPGAPNVADEQVREALRELARRYGTVGGQVVNEAAARTMLAALVPLLDLVDRLELAVLGALVASPCHAPDEHPEWHGSVVTAEDPGGKDWGLCQAQFATIGWLLIDAFKLDPAWLPRRLHAPEDCVICRGGVPDFEQQNSDARTWAETGKVVLRGGRANRPARTSRAV